MLQRSWASSEYPSGSLSSLCAMFILPETLFSSPQLVSFRFYAHRPSASAPVDGYCMSLDLKTTLYPGLSLTSLIPSTPCPQGFVPAGGTQILASDIDPADITSLPFIQGSSFCCMDRRCVVIHRDSSLLS